LPSLAIASKVKEKQQAATELKPPRLSTKMRCINWFLIGIICLCFGLNYVMLKDLGIFSMNNFKMDFIPKFSHVLSEGHKQDKPSLSNKDYPFTFSACLLIKDDNRILPEWLAYHYTVMPLRRLIVLPDPLSITSPEPILEKFKEIGMNITFWGDKDFNSMATNWYSKAANPDDMKERKNSAYKYRQLQFYHKCLLHLKELNGTATWTMLTDTDEYIVFNNYFEREVAQNKTQNSQDLRFNLPKIGHLTVSEYIAKAVKIGKACWSSLPCDVLPRLTFGSFESSAQQVAANVPPGFHALSFNTMQFRFHEDPAKKGNDIGKSIIDVTRWDGLFPAGPHRINNNCCHPWPRFSEAELRIHHYTGSLTTFLRSKGEDDPRGESTFRNRNAGVDPNLSNDDIRGWLQRFVDNVGQETAHELTEKLREWAIADYDKAAVKYGIGNFTHPFYKTNT